MDAADAIAKSTIVLFLAVAGCEGIARRRSAALRHALHCAALLAAAAVPPLALALPRWNAGILSVSAPAREPASGRVPASPVVRAGTDDGRPSSGERPSPLRPSSLPVGALALGAWAAGTAVAILLVLRDARRASALVRGADTISDAAALAALGDAARALGVSRAVRLASSPRAATPLVAGFRRPAVILPPDFRAWPEERLRTALLHEMAHVRRADCALHVATRLAGAILFFHPLARLALRRLDALREAACDDLVLAAGTRPSAYALALLDSARDVRTARFAVAMARPFPVESRIAAVLDAARERRPLARRTPARLALAAAAIAGLLASADPRSTAAALVPRFSPRGAAVQARWDDGRFHVGAFARGRIAFAGDGARVESMEPGAFLLVAARDASTGALHTFLETRDGVDASPAWSEIATSVLPETARRLAAAGRARDAGDRRASGSTLTGERATTSDGEGRVVLARFETERGPGGVFAAGPIRLDADRRTIAAMGDGAFLVAFVESDLPAVACSVPRGDGPPGPGASARSILAAALPAALEATAGAAPVVWRRSD